MAKNYTLEKQKNGKTWEAKCLYSDDIITGEKKGAVKAKANEVCPSQIKDPNSGGNENPIDLKWWLLIIAIIIIVITIYIIVK